MGRLRTGVLVAAATLLVALSQGDDLREAVERASQAALDSLA